MRVLIVEDEVLVANELEWLVEESGLEPIGHAIDSGEAVTLARQNRPDLALVDIHLNDGPTGVEAARRIAEESGAMVVFMTANPKRVPDDFAGAAGMIGKPYTSHGVKEAICWVARCLQDGAACGPPPKHLHMAPAFVTKWGLGGGGAGVGAAAMGSQN